MPGARGDVGLVTRWRFRGGLEAAKCPQPPEQSSLNLRAGICARLQHGCLHSEFWTFPIAGDQEPAPEAWCLFPTSNIVFPTSHDSRWTPKVGNCRVQSCRVQSELFNFSPVARCDSLSVRSGLLLKTAGHLIFGARGQFLGQNPQNPA